MNDFWRIFLAFTVLIQIPTNIENYPVAAKWTL